MLGNDEEIHEEKKTHIMGDGAPMKTQPVTAASTLTMHDNSRIIGFKTKHKWLLLDQSNEKLSRQPT